MLARLRNLSRFGLRTFFVLVTLSAVAVGWLGREWRLVNERKETLEALELMSPWYRDYPFRNGTKFIVGDGTASIPAVRAYLGDTPLQGGFVLPPDDERQARILRAFPEAELYLWDAVGRPLKPLDRTAH